MKTLHNNVLDWADNKGILENSSPLKQLTKTFEEASELVTALIQNDKPKIKDAIGDVQVTLIILNKLALEIKEDNYLQKSSIFKLINWLVEIFLNISKGKDVSHDIERAQKVLSDIAIENNLTLDECLKTAYSVISKRTGKMVDGVFVKDEKPTIKKASKADKEGV